MKIVIKALSSFHMVIFLNIQVFIIKGIGTINSNTDRVLKKHHIGGLPLIKKICDRMDLSKVLARHVPSHGNDKVNIIDTLILLIYNLTLGKNPLYELSEWVESLDLRAIGHSLDMSKLFSDDRFGRSLDRVYKVDRATLTTDIVTTFSNAFAVKFERIHNDSTSVKAYGRYPEKTSTGLKLNNGFSKDHRPDLKQLVYCLSISADGAVPIHHKVYSGNRTDDTTHIETWNTLYKLRMSSDFLYVADSKLCTDKQLHYIDRNKGRAVTIMPETWSEVSDFKDLLKKTKKTKIEIWRRRKPNSTNKNEYFSVFNGDYYTKTRGYRIHWIYSSEKRIRDHESRQERLKKAESAFMELNTRLNTRNLKKEDNIRAAVDKILLKHKVTNFFHIDIGTVAGSERIKIGRGRPNKNSKYKTINTIIHTLSWRRNIDELKNEAKIDGIFPLLSTDKELTSKEVLQAYKFQPRLEKRFTQFKSIHNAAPMLFKNVTRIEANMFLFFISLAVQALLEREVRNKMKKFGDEDLLIYPEARTSVHPTTNKILNNFEQISTYSIIENGNTIEEFKDELTDTQKTILNYLDISEEEYWGR